MYDMELLCKTLSLRAVICRWHLYDLLANRSAWWAPGKTLELRRRLKPYWQVIASCLAQRCRPVRRKRACPAHQENHLQGRLCSQCAGCRECAGLQRCPAAVELNGTPTVPLHELRVAPSTLVAHVCPAQHLDTAPQLTFGMGCRNTRWMYSHAAWIFIRSDHLIAPISSLAEHSSSVFLHLPMVLHSSAAATVDIFCIKRFHACRSCHAFTHASSNTPAFSSCRLQAAAVTCCC